MKRSEVNQIIQDSLDFVEKQNKFLLPPFAHWTLKDWQTKGEECREIIRQQLGWDITDFGSGDYRKIGLGIITIRNGVFEEARQGLGKSYAEKILLVGEEQITPTHFHYFKMEDIINRGGGDLVIQLWNSTPDEQLDETTPIVVSHGRRPSCRQSRRHGNPEAGRFHHAADATLSQVLGQAGHRPTSGGRSQPSQR